MVFLLQYMCCFLYIYIITDISKISETLTHFCSFFKKNNVATIILPKIYVHKLLFNFEVHYKIEVFSNRQQYLVLCLKKYRL